jgi:hypothetical protein
MLDQAATFHDCHLSDSITHLYTHEVTANWSTIALTTFTALDDLGINLCSITNRAIARPGATTPTTTALLLIAVALPLALLLLGGFCRWRWC